MDSPSGVSLILLSSDISVSFEKKKYDLQSAQNILYTVVFFSLFFLALILRHTKCVYPPLSSPLFLRKNLNAHGMRAWNLTRDAGARPIRIFKINVDLYGNMAIYENCATMCDL